MSLDNNLGCAYCEEHKTCVQRVPIFSSLNVKEMVEVQNIIRGLYLERGEALFFPGDSLQKLYVINSGKIKVSRLSESGKEQVIRILEPGDFIGEISLFTHSPIKNYAEALEDTAVCTIDGKSLENIMEKYPQIAIKILEEVSKRLEGAENIIEQIGLYDAEHRIAQTLLMMSSGNKNISLSMSKRDFASYMGMTQETLSRKLSDFQSMGLIELIGQRSINILDREGLEDITRAHSL